MYNNIQYSITKWVLLEKTSFVRLKYAQYQFVGSHSYTYSYPQRPVCVCIEFI